MSTTITSLSRRKFLATAAAAGGGLALGIDAGGIRTALAQIAIGGGGGDELGVWVFIKPNDDVVIRIARSEMGQGSLTGLAQLVSEELDCDWSKVTTEYPTPGAEPGAQSRLGRHVDRRLARHSRLAGLRASGRRRGAADAAAGRSQRVEGSRRGIEGRQGRHHARGFQAHDHLRQGGGRRCQAAGPRP